MLPDASGCLLARLYMLPMPRDGTLCWLGWKVLKGTAVAFGGRCPGH